MGRPGIVLTKIQEFAMHSQICIDKLKMAKVYSNAYKTIQKVQKVALDIVLPTFPYDISGVC